MGNGFSLDLLSWRRGRQSGVVDLRRRTRRSSWRISPRGARGTRSPRGGARSLVACTCRNCREPISGSPNQQIKTDPLRLGGSAIPMAWAGARLA